MTENVPIVAKGTPADGFQANDVSVWELGLVVLRRRRLVAAVSTLCILAGLAAWLLQDRHFIAESVIRPQFEAGSTSRLSGLAAQFGVTVGAASGAESIDLYTSLLRSREVLRQLAYTEYAFATAEGDSVRGNLIDLYGIEATSPEQEASAVVAALREQVSVQSDLNAGLIGVRVTTPWASLSTQVNRRLLTLVSDLNLARRQSQAAAEREFIEGRIQQAQRELSEAEATLERFMDSNRRYEESPQLRFEAARLERRIDLKQQVYMSLAQAYEQTRIDEIRNTPTITVLEGPERFMPRRTGMGLIQTLFIALCGAIALSLASVFIVEFLQAQARRNPAEYAQFKSLLRLRRGA